MGVELYVSTESIEEDVLDKIYDPKIDLWTGNSTRTCMSKYMKELINATRVLKYNNLLHTHPSYPLFCTPTSTIHNKQLLLRQRRFFNSFQFQKPCKKIILREFIFAAIKQM